LPSSHVSRPESTPSPQPVVQWLGAPAQAYPGSTLQLAEQPSPEAWLPSSQASMPAVTPSPQPVEHTLGAPAHE
jgi:hypothetical protein